MNRLLTTRIVLLAGALGVIAAGCGRLKPIKLISETTRVSDRNVVVFFVDGLHRPVYQQMLDAGELPQIEHYLVRRGVSIEHAVTTVPSITYAVTASLATGLVPGHHEITGNKHFDRHQLILKDYSSIPTYRDLDKTVRAPVIYEMLRDKTTVTIQTPLRRGATRNIDNWTSSGIRWYFQQYAEVDALVAERFEKIQAMVAVTGHWPELIFAYMPGLDEYGHRFGPFSERYRAALRNVDEQIGRICAALEVSGLLERTYLLLVSDHGMAPCGAHAYLDVEKLLREEAGLNFATTGPDERTVYSERWRFFDPYDAICINGSFRRVALFLRQGSDWSRSAPPAQVAPLAELLLGQEAVLLAAYRTPTGICLQSRRGTAELTRREPAPPGLHRRHYAYRVVDGTDPLGYTTDPRARALADGAFHDGRAWLEGTAGGEFPDLPVQLVELFDSDRAGDLIVFAADGWDFSREHLGGHGSVTATDMTVPLVLAGPGLPAGATIPTARTVDVAPTIVELLRGPDQNLPLDGESLAPACRKARPGGTQER